MSFFKNMDFTSNELKDTNVDGIEADKKEIDSEKPIADIESFDSKFKLDDVESWQTGSPLDGVNGHWEGERANSEWSPDLDAVPANPNMNPDKKTYQEILNGQTGINFVEGEPDFTPFAVATFKIDNFSDVRFGPGSVFDQSLDKFAEIKGITKDEARQYMKENRLTFHERRDCQTIDVIPSAINGTIKHVGGHSIYKAHQQEMVG